MFDSIAQLQFTAYNKFINFYNNNYFKNHINNEIKP